MAAILFVRIKAGLDADEFDRRLLERWPRFREVRGLVQKIYGRDDATGDVCGIYFFDSDEALAAFRDTELARTIPNAYETIDVRREAYNVLYPLWPERGPFTEVDRAAEGSRSGRYRLRPITFEAFRRCMVQRASVFIGGDRASQGTRTRRPSTRRRALASPHS
jgi:hypothetical protein